MMGEQSNVVQQQDPPGDNIFADILPYVGAAVAGYFTGGVGAPAGYAAGKMVGSQLPRSHANAPGQVQHPSSGALGNANLLQAWLQGQAQPQATVFSPYGNGFGSGTGSFGSEPGAGGGKGAAGDMNGGSEIPGLPDMNSAVAMLGGSGAAEGGSEVADLAGMLGGLA